MALQQRDNVTATDLDNKPRPLAGFTILQLIGLLAGFFLAAGAWSLLPPIQDITGAGRTMFIVHVMLTTSIFALVAFIVIVADADNAEPFARHYWAYLTRPRRYAPYARIRQQAAPGRHRSASTSNRATVLACGAIGLLLIAITGVDLILAGDAAAAMHQRMVHHQPHHKGPLIVPTPAAAWPRQSTHARPASPVPPKTQHGPRATTTRSGHVN